MAATAPACRAATLVSSLGLWTSIFWHLDETYQTQTQDFHKISLQPAPGKHSLTAVDDEGNTVSTTFFVE